MTIPPSPTESQLVFYHDLAARIRLERPAADQIADRVTAALKTRPLSIEDIDRLRREAERQIWCAPRPAWASARVAYIAAAQSPRPLLRAECSLTLGIALNTMGDFAEAIPLLQSALEYFLTDARFDRVARCECELTQLYAAIGKFGLAESTLDRARLHAGRSEDLLSNAYCDRAEGALHFEKGRHREAVAALQRAVDLFSAQDRTDEVAFTRCALAEAQRYTDLQLATITIGAARCVSIPDDLSVHQARCDRILGLIRYESTQFAETLELYRQAQTVFAREGLEHFVAVCDLSLGITYYRLNQFDLALQACTRARDVFAAKGLDSLAARCNLNLAAIYYDLNHYSKALALYEQVLPTAKAEGRTLRLIICYVNMGQCHNRLGRYDKALKLHERAYQLAHDNGQPLSAARCQENLADTYRRLGRYADALQHCQRARHVFSQQNSQGDVAECDVYMADLYLAIENYSEAVNCLTRAQATYDQTRQPVQSAICDRELARVFTKIGQMDQVRERLAHARDTFIKNELLVDAALCDLAQGELYFREQKEAEAATLFQSALDTLNPGFPDEAWRAEYGLGQCALAQEEAGQALQHWWSAVQLAHQMRSTLPTERLSGSFFANRRTLYEETLKLALALDRLEQALAVAEAGKVQTFLNWVEDRGWHDNLRDDPELAQLLDREDQLRHQLTLLRDKLRLLQTNNIQSLMRNAAPPGSDQTTVLDQLTQLSNEYENVIEQLRIAIPDRIDAQSPRLFSIDALRRDLQRCAPARWGCLAYYLLDDELVIFYLDADRLVHHTHALTSYERRVLDQCTDPAQDVRELIYGDVASGETHLQRLYRLLIPPEVADLNQDDVLIIAPHAQLHTLPFHALQSGSGPLAEQVSAVVVPSLSVLYALLHDARIPDSLEHLLALGVSDFGDRARPLPYTREDTAALQSIFGPRLECLQETQATREALIQLSQAGELAQYNVIHFSTHVMLDHVAPSQSGVLLHDDHLTYADILRLKLHTRLVVLASCEGALGRRYAGDEVIGLAQAFFFAGARTVVAGLWPVEDASTSEFMKYFYNALNTGIGVVRSLGSAQRKMAAMGYAPHHWAPFVAIGLP